MGLMSQTGKTTGFLCEGESCQSPQTDAKLLLKKIETPFLCFHLLVKVL